jgi:hypothetical protein
MAAATYKFLKFLPYGGVRIEEMRTPAADQCPWCKRGQMELEGGPSTFLPQFIRDARSRCRHRIPTWRQNPSSRAWLKSKRKQAEEDDRLRLKRWDQRSPRARARNAAHRRAVARGIPKQDARLSYGMATAARRLCVRQDRALNATRTLVRSK